MSIDHARATRDLLIFIPILDLVLYNSSQGITRFQDFSRTWPDWWSTADMTSIACTCVMIVSQCLQISSGFESTPQHHLGMESTFLLWRRDNSIRLCKKDRRPIISLYDDHEEAWSHGH
jgi:hypothetical protein